MIRPVTKDLCPFPERPKKARKGEAGRVLIIGGSEEYTGSPVLAALGAYKAGVDWVDIAAPRKVAWTINRKSPSIVTMKLPCASFSKAMVPRVLKEAQRVDAVLIGNGMGRTPSRLAFVRAVLKRLDKPLVIDADALYATDLENIKSKQVICTPHAKEFEALLEATGVDEKGVLKFLSPNKVILLKGPVDRILTGPEEYRNKTGCAEMAVAGTGDVLAGLCVGFLAQGYPPWRAACMAALLNGKGGEAAHKDLGNFTAEELTHYLKW